MTTSSSMKLSTKLGLAFAAMVAITLLVAGIAYNRMSLLNTAASDMSTNWLPSIKVLGDVRTFLNQSRRAEADHLMAPVASEKTEIEARLAELRTKTADAVKAYGPMIASPEEKAAFEAFSKDREAWLAVRPKMFKLSHEGKAAEALELFRGESRTHFNAMAANLGKGVDINNKGSIESAASGVSAYASAQVWMTVSSVVALLTGIVLALWIIRGVTRQLGGEPAEAAEMARRVADGDLSAAITVRPGDDSSLLAALKRMQDSLSSIVNGVRQNADSVATASGQISQGNNDLSSRTEEQASALQQTAASMKELATTVEQNAANAQQGNELAVAASTVAARGGEVVGQVVETMKGINDSSRKIADIISVIDGIAFQTNILALNAAVEAARAGEQGRGFAVVASEVRSLAQRSADAAKEIKGLITASVERVEQGSALVDQAGVTMDEVVQSIRKVTDLMGEISAASRQQSAGVAQIGEAVNQMDQATQQNAALVEESAAAADSLKGQAQQLVGAVSVFKLEAGHSAANAATRPHSAPAPAAANVVKPSFKAKAVAAKAAPARADAAPAPAKTGTDDDWQSF